MKCNFCGFEHEEELVYCPRCGRQIEPEAPAISLNPMADRLAAVFRSGLYLTICILQSVVALKVLSSFFSGGGGIPVFQVLFTIFLWLGFAQGRRGFVDHLQVRNLSGTVFAYYIVQYVAAGLVAVIGLLFTALFGAIGNSSLIMDELLAEAEFESLAEAELVKVFFGAAGGIFLIIFLIAAAGVVLINVFGIRKIHKFLQSTYRSVEFNENRIVCARAAKNWLIVLGSIGVAVSALALLTIPLQVYAGSAAAQSTTTVLSLIPSVCEGFCGIFAGVLINKYFVAK